MAITSSDLYMFIPSSVTYTYFKVKMMSESQNDCCIFFSKFWNDQVPPCYTCCIHRQDYIHTFYFKDSGMYQTNESAPAQGISLANSSLFSLEWIHLHFIFLYLHWTNHVLSKWPHVLSHCRIVLCKTCFHILKKKERGRAGKLLLMSMCYTCMPEIAGSKWCNVTS